MRYIKKEKKIKNKRNTTLNRFIGIENRFGSVLVVVAFDFLFVCFSFTLIDLEESDFL